MDYVVWVRTLWDRKKMWILTFYKRNVEVPDESVVIRVPVFEKCTHICFSIPVMGMASLCGNDIKMEMSPPLACAWDS